MDGNYRVEILYLPDLPFTIGPSDFVVKNLCLQFTTLQADMHNAPVNVVYSIVQPLKKARQCPGQRTYK